MLFPQTQDSACPPVNVLSTRKDQVGFERSENCRGGQTRNVAQSRFRVLDFRHVTAVAIAVLLALAVSPSSLPAQAVNNAQIHGVIQDATGAVVSGAEVKATQADTSRSQTAVTGGDGSYVLPDLPIGQYTLEVTAKSFNRFLQTGIVLQVGQNVNITVTLNVGNVSQEVHVSADAAMVETQNTSVSAVIDQHRIVDLPLNGRQVTDLIVLSGGAAQPPNAQGRDVTSHDYVNSIAISVNGGQINGNNYLLDGADNNDSHSNINMPFPFPDALQEYSVQTGGISARYGLQCLRENCTRYL